jgi:hypothetical protein
VEGNAIAGPILPSSPWPASVEQPVPFAEAAHGRLDFLDFEPKPPAHVL